MRTLAIEINDAGLVVAGDEGVLAVEPGYAVVDGERIALGSDAYAQFRLKPRSVSNRFWSELSLEPGSAGVEGPRNAAELAFLQMESLWARFGKPAADTVLVVPGHYDQQQLGILLGLARECGMPVLAMVDAAVAASGRAYPGRQLLYADASLHRISVTALEQGEEVSAQFERGLEEIGIAQLNDLWAKRISELFVFGTRFDPFHDAESEQRLYAALPGWLGSMNDRESAEFRLSSDSEEFSIDIERKQLLAAAAGFYKAFVQLVAQARQASSGLVLQLSDRLSRLPGLISELSRLDDAEIVVVPQGYAATSALRHLDEIAGGDQVKLLRHLRWLEPPADPPSAKTEPRPPREAGAASETLKPTHLVYRGFAYAVDGGLSVGRAESAGGSSIVVDDQSGGVSRSHCELGMRDGELVLRDLSSYGTFVNEKRVSGEEILKPADVIRIGTPGAELLVVAVEKFSGA